MLVAALISLFLSSQSQFFIWFISLFSPLSLLFISSLWISPIIFYSCVNITAMREYKEWKSHAEIRSHWVILTCFLSYISPSFSLTLPFSPSLLLLLSLSRVRCLLIPLFSLVQSHIHTQAHADCLTPTHAQTYSTHTHTHISTR